jgi:hypothetical protein
MSNELKTFRYLIGIVFTALAALAIYEEMKKPEEEREWHGKIANLIPYDFRMPTIERLRSKLWNPEDSRILTEHVFGVGWAINFHALLQRLQGTEQEPSTPSTDDLD